MKITINNENLVVEKSYTLQNIDGVYYNGCILDSPPRGSKLIGSVRTSDAMHLFVYESRSKTILKTMLQLLLASLLVTSIAYVVIAVISMKFSDFKNPSYNSELTYIDGAINVNIINKNMPCTVYAVIDGVKSNEVVLEENSECEYLELNINEGLFYEGTLVFVGKEVKKTFPISVSGIMKKGESLLEQEKTLEKRKVVR